MSNDARNANANPSSLSPPNPLNAPTDAFTSARDVLLDIGEPRSREITSSVSRESINKPNELRQRRSANTSKEKMNEQVIVETIIEPVVANLEVKSGDANNNNQVSKKDTDKDGIKRSINSFFDAAKVLIEDRRDVRQRGHQHAATAPAKTGFDGEILNSAVISPDYYDDHHHHSHHFFRKPDLHVTETLKSHLKHAAETKDKAIREINERRRKMLRKIYNLLENPRSSKAAFYVQAFLICIAIGSVTILCFESIVPLSRNSPMAWMVLELLFGAILIVEFCLRLFTFPYAKETGKVSYWEFWRNPLTICDFLGLLPFFIQMALQVQETDTTNSVFNIIRLLRILRLLRLFRYAKRSRRFRVITEAIIRAKDGIVLFLFIAILGIVIWSSLVFHAEISICELQDDDIYVYTSGPKVGQHCAFQSIVEAFWFAIVTQATVGYGDVVPVSIPGKVVAGVSILTANILFTLPITIVSASLSEVYAQENARREQKRQQRLTRRASADNGLGGIDKTTGKPHSQPHRQSISSLQSASRSILGSIGSLSHSHSNSNDHHGSRDLISNFSSSPDALSASSPTHGSLQGLSASSPTHGSLQGLSASPPTRLPAKRPSISISVQDIQLQELKAKIGSGPDAADLMSLLSMVDTIAEDIHVMQARLRRMETNRQELLQVIKRRVEEK